MRSIVAKHTARKWWYRWIRSFNWFAFRYYWFVWLLFISSTALLLYLILTHKDAHGCNTQRIEKSIEIINKQLDSCCSCNQALSNGFENPDSLERLKDSIPQAPTENCAVHFTGLIMGGAPVNNNISKVYVEDNSSEYVGSGFYPNNSAAFPKAVNTTFDGIAIASGAHLIIYSKPNFQGSILLDVVGPKIINNVRWKDDERYNHCMTDVFPGDLESKFPRRVRIWSNSDMHNWSYGSCKIYCE